MQKNTCNAVCKFSFLQFVLLQSSSCTSCVWEQRMALSVCWGSLKIQCRTTCHLDAPDFPHRSKQEMLYVPEQSSLKMDLPLLSLEHLRMEQWVKNILSMHRKWFHKREFSSLNSILNSVSQSWCRWMSTTQRRPCPSVTILYLQLSPVPRCVQRLRRSGESYDKTKLIWTVMFLPD